MSLTIWNTVLEAGDVVMTTSPEGIVSCWQVNDEGGFSPIAAQTAIDTKATKTLKRRVEGGDRYIEVTDGVEIDDDE